MGKLSELIGQPIVSLLRFVGPKDSRTHNDDFRRLCPTLFGFKRFDTETDEEQSEHLCRFN